jgi:4-phosphopantoate--beta-alanine ligase
MIPKSHPRYESLIKREKIIEGFKRGIVAYAGLIAHGRGETFDYLIGERTENFAWVAERAAVAKLLLAKNPVISVNGNVTALAVEEVITLSKILNAKIEVNLFYRTEERIKKIVEEFKLHGAEILGENPDARIPNLEHSRALCTKEGIYSADVVLVPLEDGDRTKALKDMGKFVITIDLNPLSRTARTADITIVDELTRALNNMIKIAKNMNDEEALKTIAHYNNQAVLAESLEHINRRLRELSLTFQPLQV